MKRNKRWIALATALTLTVLGGSAALAANGDENDPLVTLSYLKQVFLPQVVEQVEKDTEVRQKELSQSFATQVDQYKTEMKGMVNGGGADSGTYVLVTLTKGQTMTLDLGSEVLLRVGTVTVNCEANPALIDVSTGGTLDKGGSLTKNHLYMATMTDRVLTAAADSVKIMVRGGYTVA